MKELSLNILDIAMNSVKAGAKNITISITESGDVLSIAITDDGCGMTKEQTDKLSDPFFTTRSTRKVGLGIPFFKLAAEQTGGKLEIKSISSEDNQNNHGTTGFAFFYKNHIDFTPLGDILSTVITLIQGSPDIDFHFMHITDDRNVCFSTKEIREQLGVIPLNEPEILNWISDYIKEQYE